MVAQPCGPNSDGALIIGGQLARRGSVLGNWSRFVRPGFVRVQATVLPQLGVNVSAFADPATGRVVVVAINTTAAELVQTFALTGGAVSTTATPWITSDDYALVAQEPIAVTDGTFSYALPAKSVTSFVSN